MVLWPKAKPTPAGPQAGLPATNSSANGAQPLATPPDVSGGLAGLPELVEDTPHPPAPTLLIPVLNRTKEVEFDFPKLSALKAGGQPKPSQPQHREGGAMSLDEIKNAVTFIKVEAGQNSATGSGFVMRTEGNGGLVATNCHVIAGVLLEGLRDPKSVPRATVVFDSGLPTEQQKQGTIVAFDFDSDLALIRVEGVTRMPRPIDPQFAPAPTETMPVLICGFPFGESLSTGSRSPAVTIGKGSVSSVRRDDEGAVAMVQIDGALNPGNSGGPIVDGEGRLVGIAVATIKGSGIGAAIPPDDLLAMLEGRVHSPLFLPAGLEGGQAAFQVLVPVIDPLKRIQSVGLNVLPADRAPADADRPTDGSWKVLPGATKLDLEIQGRGLATGQLRLPAGGPGAVVLQLTCVTAAGKVAASRPVPFRLNVNAVQTGDDAMAMTVLNRAPEKFEGQLVVVRGHLYPTVVGRGNVSELQVFNENNAKPMNLYFVTTPEIATQLGELPLTELMLPVRLTGQVGKRTPNGSAPVRVTRIDFLGRGNRVVKSVPSDDGLDDPFIALNRAPNKYAGQTLAIIGLLSPVVVGRGGEMELQVMLPNGRRPNNLNFTTSRDLATQLTDLGLKGEPLVARMTVRIENGGALKSRLATVTKIELLDRNGRAAKTLQ